MSEGFEHNAEAKKQEAEKHYRETLQTLGNLNENEITELVNFEFHAGSVSVDDQVRRYYLKLKSEKPEKAEQMRNESEAIIQKGIASPEDVKNLCFTLYKYWSGFLINFEGHSYSVHHGKLNMDGKEVE